VQPSIAPWLSVADGSRALQFYAAAFGAQERYRFEDSGRVVVARLAIGPAELWIQEDPDARGAAGPIRMILTVADPDAVFAQALGAGATEVFPVIDDHGWRVGRLADPFGHHWEVGRPLQA
jgi:PhnB protein